MEENVSAHAFYRFFRLMLNICVLQQHVKGLRENIASENRQLRLEQGKQERLAISITDQMHAEAQVCSHWLIENSA